MLHKNLKWLGLVALVALVAPMIMGFNVQSEPSTVVHQCKAPWYETKTTEMCNQQTGSLYVFTWSKKHYEEWDSRKRVCVAKEGPWVLKDVDVIKGGCKLTTVCLNDETVQLPKNEIPEGTPLGACPVQEFMVKFFGDFGTTQPILVANAYGVDEIYVGMNNLHYGQERTRNGVKTFMIDNFPGEVKDQNFLHYIPVYFDGSSWKLWPGKYWVGDWSSEFATETSICYLVKQGVILDSCPGAPKDWTMFWPSLDLKP